MTSFKHLAPPNKKWWWRKSKHKSGGLGQVEVLIALAVFSAGFLAGGKIVSNHYDSAALKAERQAHQQYLDQVARGNVLAARLATSETQIRTIATWKAKNVKNHTTGRPCLSAGAVGLLSASSDSAATGTGQPAPENAGRPASAESNGVTDADILDWAITAQGEYRTCAKRLNSLIDYEEGR